MPLEHIAAMEIEKENKPSKKGTGHTNRFRILIHSIYWILIIIYCLVKYNDQF